MSAEIKCLRCGGEMFEGFVLDYGDYSVKRQQVWVEGTPESSLWSGLKTSGRESFAVQALRCDDCNYLEFYTTERVQL